jgi:type VI secretion system protein ImpL
MRQRPTLIRLAADLLLANRRRRFTARELAEALLAANPGHFAAKREAYEAKNPGKSVAHQLEREIYARRHAIVEADPAIETDASDRSRLVRLTFVPVDGGTPAVRSKEGPWGWFRLLQEAQLALQGRPPDLYAVTFAAGTHAASFELQADSVDNPFDLGLFQRFRCPDGL